MRIHLVNPRWESVPACQQRRTSGGGKLRLNQTGRPSTPLEGHHKPTAPLQCAVDSETRVNRAVIPIQLGGACGGGAVRRLKRKQNCSKSQPLLNAPNAPVDFFEHACCRLV